MHEIVKYFILTENQSHCFNRRFVIHSHRRSIRKELQIRCMYRAGVTRLGTFSAISAFHCRFGTGGVPVAGTAAAGTVHTQLAQYPAAGTENSTAVHMYMYLGTCSWYCDLSYNVEYTLHCIPTVYSDVRLRY